MSTLSSSGIRHSPSSEQLWRKFRILEIKICRVFTQIATEFRTPTRLCVYLFWLWRPSPPSSAAAWKTPAVCLERPPWPFDLCQSWCPEKKTCNHWAHMLWRGIWPDWGAWEFGGDFEELSLRWLAPPWPRNYPSSLTCWSRYFRQGMLWRLSRIDKDMLLSGGPLWDWNRCTCCLSTFNPKNEGPQGLLIAACMFDSGHLWKDNSHAPYFWPNSRDFPQMDTTNGSDHQDNFPYWSHNYRLFRAVFPVRQVHNDLSFIRIMVNQVLDML